VRKVNESEAESAPLPIGSLVSVDRPSAWTGHYYRFRIACHSESPRTLPVKVERKERNC